MGLAVDRKLGVLLIVALVSLTACTQTVQANAISNATTTPYATAPLTPDSSSAVQTQTWAIIIIAILLVVVYVALVFLLFKKG